MHNLRDNYIIDSDLFGCFLVNKLFLDLLLNLLLKLQKFKMHHATRYVFISDFFEFFFVFIIAFLHPVFGFFNIIRYLNIFKTISRTEKLVRGTLNRLHSLHCHLKLMLFEC